MTCEEGQICKPPRGMRLAGGRRPSVPLRPALDSRHRSIYRRHHSHSPFLRRKPESEPDLKHRLLLSLVSFLTVTALAPAESSGFAAARGLYEAKKPFEARQAFEALLVTEPSNDGVHYYLGRLALEREDREAAVSELEAAVSLAPDSARDHQALGDAYGYSAMRASVVNRFSLALKCAAEFQRAEALDPKDVDTHERLLEYYSRAPWIIGGSHDKAMEEAEAIRGLDPVRGHQAYAALYLTDGKYDLALSELDGALKTAPDDYVALFEVGLVAVVSGQHLDRGLASLRHCLKLSAPRGAPSHSAAQWRLGNILEKKGDPAGARVAYEAALKLNPKFTPASDSLRKLASANGGG
jgi:tetratricopeptide (TPR) repeat protein